ncbi:MAG: hemerythrin domain-containing protein [Acidobacteriia bacterium]|nr:hemerythrin domain-containing protein [Terriglobia bacterium]
MSMFSEVFRVSDARIESLLGLSEPARSLQSIFEAAEKNPGLDVEDAASLIAWAREPERREEIHAAAQRVRERLAPRTVEFVIPVYLTSFCQNECLYCGYRHSNALAERVRLSLDEFSRELDLILSWGHRQIELVLSEDPEFGPQVLARYVELTRQKLDRLGGGVVGLCSPVYEREDYVRLRAAGLEWVVEWQETYHQPHFDRWHVMGSPKRDFEFRLDLWDRVIAAGIRKIALGALLGLYDWRYDALATIEHGNYLRRAYSLEPHALGIPRLKPARGVLASQKPSRFTVSDDHYRLILSLYHLAFPRSRLFFNTRENYEMNISMVAAGDLFTVDCDTFPGGYLRRDTPGQFSTHGFPDRREVVRVLAARGLASLYLESETPLAAAEPPAQALPPDTLKWLEEHAQIRAGLEDWQAILAGFTLHRGEDSTERQAALAALHMTMHFFKTFVIEHCRREETALFPAFPQDPDVTPQLQVFRTAHERLGIDLDKFERQMASYQLSGDPSVLLTVGQRIIRELAEHLAAEEGLAKKQSFVLGPPSVVR